jgi:hypothetical protein
MRTTVILEPDVADRLRQIMGERDLTFKEAVNSTLRRGSETAAESRLYEVPSHAPGLKPGIDGDRIIHFFDDLEDRERLNRMTYDL